MSNGNINPVWRRNALLATAGIFMLFAVIIHPGLLLSFASPKAILILSLRAAAGFFAAKGIQKSAKFFLRKPVNPWYCRPKAFVFLAIIMPLANVLYIALSILVAGILQTKHAIFCIASIPEFMAFELLWIVLLELPLPKYHSAAKNTALSRKPAVTCYKQNPLNQSRTEK